MSAALLRASAITGLLKLQGALAAHPHLSPAAAAQYLRETDPQAAAVDLEGGCQLFDLLDAFELRGTTLDAPYPDAHATFRACITAIARACSPGWLSTLRIGREALRSGLDENAYQCFQIAGAFEPRPAAHVLLWFDELVRMQYAAQDQQNLLVGREGELLTLEAETKKLAELTIERSPRWVALDDNRAGFDIESWRRDDQGNEISILIEVKACTSDSCRFFLTRNEWQNALRYPQQYMLQVWRLADKATAVLTSAELGSHVPLDQGGGRWESVLVQLGAQRFDK